MSRFSAHPRFFSFRFHSMPYDVVKQSRAYLKFLSYIFIQRTIRGAGAVVLPFFIHSERIPRRRAVYILFIYVVHTYGDSQHRTHRN